MPVISSSPTITHARRDRAQPRTPYEVSMPLGPAKPLVMMQMYTLYKDKVGLALSER